MPRDELEGKKGSKEKGKGNIAKLVVESRPKKRGREEKMGA